MNRIDRWMDKWREDGWMNRVNDEDTSPWSMLNVWMDRRAKGGWMNKVTIKTSKVYAYSLSTSIFYSTNTVRNFDCQLEFETRGQRPNESQKAVIIDMMKSVGEIASEIWPVLWFFTHFCEKFYLNLWPWPKVKVIGTWVIECALMGCTLVPSVKSVGEIASEIWQVVWWFTHFGEILTLTFDLDRRSRSKVKIKISQKLVKKTKNWSYLGGYFTYRLHTWYQGTTQ